MGIARGRERGLLCWLLTDVLHRLMTGGLCLLACWFCLFVCYQTDVLYHSDWCLI